MTLYRQYRPQNFSDLKGQDHVVEVLKSSLKQDKASHAYLFTGPRGTGKTSTARILGRALNCTDLKDHGPCNTCEACTASLEERLTDFIEIDAASHGLVDDARALVEQAKFMPSQVQKKVYIIDEVHMLSKSAFNALLKIIEEPPEHVHFIMATTEAHKVLETIKSRCQRFDFHLSEELALAEHIVEIATKESIELDDEAKHLLARHARGSYRDALSLLEQFTGMTKVSQEDVRHILGLSDAEKTKEFIDDLLAFKTKECLEKITVSLREGHDPYQFCQAILAEMRKTLLKDSSVLPLEWIENFYSALEKLRSPLLPELPLELAVYRCHREAPQLAASPVADPIKTVPVMKKEEVVPKVEKKEEAVVLEKSTVVEEKKPEVEVNTETEAVEDEKLTVTGTFDKDVFIKSIDQASLRTLVKYSQLGFIGNQLSIAAKSDFEIKKMKDQQNFSYLLDLLQTHIGAKCTIDISLQEKSDEPDGLKSTDLESVF